MTLFRTLCMDKKKVVPVIIYALQLYSSKVLMRSLSVYGDYEKYSDYKYDTLEVPLNIQYACLDSQAFSSLRKISVQDYDYSCNILRWFQRFLP